jgi:transposase
MQAALKPQINKTDRNDARGIVRMRLCRPVDVKTPRSQKLQMLLTHRKLLMASPHIDQRSQAATIPQQM